MTVPGGKKLLQRVEVVTRCCRGLKALRGGRRGIWVRPSQGQYEAVQKKSFARVTRPNPPAESDLRSLAGPGQLYSCICLKWTCHTISIININMNHIIIIVIVIISIIILISSSSSSSSSSSNDNNTNMCIIIIIISSNMFL